MHVVKRDGRREAVMFDKITARVKKLCYGFDPKHIDPQVIAMPHTHAISAGGVTPSGRADRRTPEPRLLTPTTRPRRRSSR